MTTDYYKRIKALAVFSSVTATYDINCEAKFRVIYLMTKQINYMETNRTTTSYRIETACEQAY